MEKLVLRPKPISKNTGVFDSKSLLNVNPTCAGTSELTLDRNVLDGKAEDDGPDHSKSHFYIAVNDL